MKRFLLPLLAILLFAVNANAQQRIEKIEYQESSARNLEPEHLMLLTPLIADLEVSAVKIRHTETEAFENVVITQDLLKLMPELKKVALSRAARASNADVLVGTTIDVITNDNGRIEITVTGYPAFYRNFRKAETSDLEVIRFARLVEHDNENTTVIEDPKSKTTIKEIK